MSTEPKLFNLSLLEELDDENFIVEIINLYLKDTRIGLEEMKQALDTGSYGMVHKTAHKLKSSTGMIQANYLFALLESIEKITKTEDEAGPVGELVQKAGYEFNRLKEGLELHLVKLKIVAC